MRRIASSFLLIALFALPARADVRAEIEKRSLQFFREHTHPVTGLALDRAPNRAPDPLDRPNTMASLASTGFGMAVLANASARGLVPRETARLTILKGLRFVWNRLEHHHGWLYHFVDWSTGARFGRSEVSTVDTGWFIAGALTAAAYFPGDEIDTLAHQLYQRLDFDDMRTHGGLKPDKRTLSMGWSPEVGYLPPQWDTYSEHLILHILGLGHPTRPLALESWKAWRRRTLDLAPGIRLMGSDQSLFVHQYSHLFIDFRKWRDGTFNYFHNSVLATSRDKTLCAADGRFASYREGFWGRSASGSTHGYAAFSPVFHDGTVCPGCAGASAPFLPRSVLADLDAWVKGSHGTRIWGRYGFADSVNLDVDWVDPDVIGITVGALYLAMADLRPAARPWALFETDPAVRRGLYRAMSPH